MVSSVSFIGSFRKQEHYASVKKAVEMCVNEGIIVRSPKGSKIKTSVNDFVIFETDDVQLTPSEIQMITLDKIIHSDVVFVCDLNGYIGRTTSFEIGFCMSRRIPLYFLNKPEDLPIFVDDEHIMDIEKFVSILSQQDPTYNSFYTDREDVKRAVQNVWPELKTINENNNQKRVVICGSMQFYDEMLMCQKKLLEAGVEAIVPKDEGELPENISEENFRLFKKKVSNAYLKKIREKETYCILVVNKEKHGMPNYIGANTFVEIAMAFAWNRKIFIYEDIYEPYKDELLAWDSISLQEDLTPLISEYNKTLCSEKNSYQEYYQYSLKDYNCD